MDSPPPSSGRRPCFAEEDNGLASLAEFSGTGNHHLNNNNNNNNRHNHYRTVIPRRTGSIRSLIPLSTASTSPRSANFSESVNHFLDACSLCKKPLGGNRDIFMYRDVPFCSEECRQEEIQVDYAKEKRNSLASMKAMRRKQKDSAAKEEARKEYFRAGTVAAA